MKKKLILQTLENWWKWLWNWKIWTPERKNSYWILGVGIIAFLVSLSLVSVRGKMVEKNQESIEKEMLQQELTTQEELEEEKKQKKQEVEKFIKERGRKPCFVPFYDYAPFFSFLIVVIIAPIAEESVCRYLVFEIFGKKNPLSYLFSGGLFILLHWLVIGGVVNWWSLGILLITYLPMTIYFIYAYYKSNWNILYPIWAHSTWNLTVLIFSVIATYSKVKT